MVLPSQYVSMNNLGKFFPPWTVPRDVWQTALRPDVSGIAVDVHLFHEAGCWMVHKYRVYKDPFPHPAIRGGGGGVINKLLSLVGRAMAIVQLTHLHISIPASGSARGAIPEECFPPVPLPWVSADPRRVSFASEVTVLGVAPESEQSPDQVPGDLMEIQIHDPVCPDIPEEDTMDVSTEVSDAHIYSRVLSAFPG